MNFIIFIVFILSIKYLKASLFLKNESHTIFHQSSNKTDSRINISDLNFCEGCCDDLNEENELKEIIESRLDLNYFNNIEALKRRETDIYKDIKLCVSERPLFSCVDLCMCKTESCVYKQIKRAKKVLKRAYNCTRKELKKRNEQFTFNDLEDRRLNLRQCWFNLTSDEIFRLKLKLMEKTDLLSKKDEENQSDQSYDQNSNEEHNKASPITNSLSAASLSPLCLLNCVCLLFAILEFRFHNFFA